jgi:2-dehydro-3-deoxygalactonokinase
LSSKLLAIDWGTTNRRVYLLDQSGAILLREDDDQGMLAMRGRNYVAELARIRILYGDFPVLIAGMAGSREGWIEVPYVSCPASVKDIVSKIHWVEPQRTGIVPGVSINLSDRSDIMRGEEVQLLGASLAGMVDQDSLLCQPGTHCKWAEMDGGAIISFITAMTGELYSLLKNHSLLPGGLDDGVFDEVAFLEGVSSGGSGDFLANIFGLRAARMFGRRTAQDSTAYLSGLIIGADVNARSIHRHVGVIADPFLGGLYATAIAHNGGTATIVDSQAAFAEGMLAIWNHS